MESDDEVFDEIAQAVGEKCNEATTDVTMETPQKKKRKRPQVTTVWSNESGLELIQAVESHPCIWEYSCAEYKDRNKREKAWQSVGQKCIGHTVDECKAKWANIKTAFQNVHKKIYTTKSGQGAECQQPHWPFWSAMQFLSKHDKAKRTSSVSTLDLEESSSPNTSESLSPPKVAEKEKSTVSAQEAMQIALKSLSEEDDKWHAFGMYVAAQLRDMAKTNSAAANNLQVIILKHTMDSIVDLNISQ